MKILIILLALFSFALQSDGQNEGIQINDSTLETLTVIDVPNNSKDEIFTKLNKWIALNYRSANDVLQLNDKESGVIIVRGIYSNGSWVDVLHTLQMDVKENKVRIKIGSMYCNYGRSEEYTMKKVISTRSFFSKRQTQQFKQLMINKINTTVKSIENYLLLADDSKW